MLNLFTARTQQKFNENTFLANARNADPNYEEKEKIERLQARIFASVEQSLLQEIELD